MEVAVGNKELVDKALANEFDIILMDLLMTFIDGYIPANLIDCNIPGLPIVALTASVMMDKKIKLFLQVC